MISLSESERAVLSVCQLQADLPLKELAAQAKLSPRATARALEKLQSRGLLTPYVLVNHFAQGMIEAGIYLTFGAGGGDSLQKLSRALPSHPAIAGATELGGTYSLCLDLLVPELSGIQRVLEEVASSVGAPVAAKATVIRSARTVYQRKYLGGISRRKRVSMAPSGPLEHLDHLDRRILDCCTKFPALSHRELSRRAGIPQSTFEYRLKHLGQRGVFLGFAYAFRSLAAGVSTFRVLTRVKRPSAKGHRELQAFCEKHENTVTLNDCIGAWDHEMRVEFETPSEVNRFRQALLNAFPEYLADAEVLPFLGTLKLSTFSP